jgi:glycosyltransferase involved in cell wall biosynthesis
VFVDGGSRDATVPIVESAMAEAQRRGIPTRCTLIHQHNRGITQAWNIGLGAVTSDIVCILNSDDWYERDTTERMLARFRRHPGAEVVLGLGRYLRGADDPAPRISRPRPFFVLPFAMTVIHPACFVRTSVYSRIGSFDERYRTAADYDFIYRCRRGGVRFVRAPEIVVNVLRGGFAESNLALGWREVADIGRRHARWSILPGAGALARQLFKR